MSGKRVYWGVRTFCVLTGASRGIGQEIAYQFARKFKPGSVLVLLARSESGLQETQKQLAKVAPGVTVKIIPVDLSNPSNEKYYSLINGVLDGLKLRPGDFEHAVMVHNAASMPLGDLIDNDDLDLIHSTMHFNVYGCMSLNVQFLKIFHKTSGPKRSVINVSSIASVIPIGLSGLYCMTKAARNMYFKTIAMEDPTLDVFSYGPGPTDTDMGRDRFQHEDPAVIAKMKEKDLILTTAKTVGWLVDLLEKGNYESGEFRDILGMDKYAFLTDAFAR